MAMSLPSRKGIIIATGTLAAVPLIPSLADTSDWTNHQAVEVKDLPASLVVLGGGAVGLEPRACWPIGDITGDGLYPPSDPPGRCGDGRIFRRSGQSEVKSSTP